ncbi:MAG: amino acid adenylation domain-containing protein, partial [Acidobacteriota bacterium]
EELLAGAVGEVLDIEGGLERVGRDDSFFDLGGHSLLAARLVARVRDLFGVELPVRTLFERPTVAGLAEEVEALAAAGEGLEAPPVEALPREAPPFTFPPSFSQERLWFLDRLQPGETAYNIPLAARLRGALDPAALRAALDGVVRRHEPLRTTFGTEAGDPVQVIAAERSVPLPVADLRGLPADARQAEARRLAALEAATPFDLERGPLLRATLLALEPDEHVLLLDMHHIVSDGWSMGVLIRELGALYGAAVEGPAPVPDPERAGLAPLPVQYADYAVWQRRWLEGDALERQLAFWRERLDGMPDVLELPTDRPRPAVQSDRGASVPVAIDPELGTALRRLDREATPFMILLAGFQALLGRLSGHDDLAVGTPVANRSRSEVEGLIGFFVNTLVMRGELAGDPGFGDLVDRVRRGALEAFARQDLPFEKLVEELAPERSLAHSPLVQVLFVLQNVPLGALELPGLALEPLRDVRPAAKLDLTLTLFETDDGGFTGTLDYARDLFDRTTALRLTRHLEALLAGAAAAPSTPLSELPLMSAAERAQLLEWNDSAVAYPEDVRLEELIAIQAEATPDRVALSADGDSLTFAGLGARSGSLAARLRRLGVGPEVRVGVCAERSLEMVIGLLAVLEAGGAYVPVDPSYPADRLTYMLEDAGVPVLLSQRRWLDELPELAAGGAEVVILDGPDGTGAVAEDGGPGRSGAATARSLAYTIYTSGSTGRPKGAMNEHRGIVNRLLWMRDEYGLGESDRVLQKTPYSFDVSVWELFLPLLAGARLVMARPGGHQDPSYLVETVVREGITTMHFVPSMLQAFVEAPGIERVARAGTLRRVIASGEALPADLRDRFFDRVAGTELHNLYGPTEAAVDVTAWPCAGDERGVPIGRPVANTRIHLLDRHLRPVPPGVAGELHIGGAQVGRGYLGRPELTAGTFIPDPFAAGAADRGLHGRPGDRLYKTGDLARFLPDGAIEFLGRIDHQVKVRGFRIELGEIEAALGEHPAVREAVAMAWSGVGAGAGDTRLVAYLVTHPPESGEDAVDPDELARFLGESLPEYMVPAAFTVLDELPLTPSGKVDRRSLPDPEWGAGLEAGYVAPRGPLEELVAGVWAELLGVERVGVRDDFFRLGGHSLLAPRILARLGEATGVELPIMALFEAPTVAGVAERIEERRAAGETGGAVPPIHRVPREERTGADGVVTFEPSFAQERLWFLDRLEPESPWYNIPTALRLRGGLDRVALEVALGEIVRRHEALRTVFGERDGAPVQRVRPVFADGFGGLGWIDLTGLGPERREAELRRLAADEAERPFDLGAGPLLRARLALLETEDHALLVTLHHIVSDGWSGGVLLRELGALYRAALGVDGEVPPELPVQYGDYAVWQREWLTGAALEAQLEYWRERLAGAPAVLEMPTDRPRPPVRRNRGGRVPVVTGSAASRSVDALARAEGASRFMVLTSALFALLRRVSGQDDLVVGTPVAGRERPEVEPLIGFFVNTLALRLEPPSTDGPESFRDLLGRVREHALGAFAHQDVPFEKLVEELQPSRDPSYTPIFQVVFALQEAPLGDPGLPGLEADAFEPESRTAKFDLILSLLDDGDRAGGEGLAGSLEYDRDLFDRTTATRLARQFRILLDGALGRPDRALAELPLLAPEERHEVLLGWNDTRSDYPREQTVDALFRRVAARMPDAVAVEFDADDDPGGRTERLTYAELERRVHRLAAHLRSLPDLATLQGGGVGPEVPVALAMERSADLVVAMLGILTAGGFFVPLDPSYPAERLAYMLEDSGAPVLVTREREAAAFGDLAGDAVTTVLADRLGPEEDGAPAPEDLDAPGTVGSEGLAYAMYTSGSTGRPKGVAVPHHGITRLILETNFIHLGPGDRMAQAANASFDAATLEFWGPLLTGGTVVGVDRDVSIDPERLASWLRTRRIDSMFLTTSLFEQVATADPSAFAPLRDALFGGEAVDPTPLRKVLAAEAPRRLVNGYGPTESTTFATTETVRRVDDRAVSVPIGRPIANSRVYLLDPAGRPVPPGVPGELMIAGDGLARCYLGRPALTAERFVPDPFARPGGGRLYRTGDLARFLPDGRVEFLGRVDHQVKIRGFRIEPGEVEAVLNAHPAVREVAVVTWDDGAGRLELAAYLVPEGGEEAGAAVEAAREELRERMPEFMVPAFFVVLEELPLNPNGKVDRRVLAAMDPRE